MSSFDEKEYDKHGAFRAQDLGDSSAVIILSVEAWTLMETFDPEPRKTFTDRSQCSFRIDGVEVSIIKGPINVSWATKHDEICCLKLGTDISSVEMPRLPNTSVPFLAFILCQTSNTKVLFDKYMEGIEQPRKPSIAVKMPERNSGWSQQTYKQMEDMLKATICIQYLEDARINIKWNKFMSSCKNLPHGALLAQSMKSYSSFMDLSCVQESHVNNEKTGRTRPPELNLVARARRGRVSISSSSRGKPIKQTPLCVTPANLTRNDNAISSRHPLDQMITPPTEQRQSSEMAGNYFLPIRTWVSGTQLLESSPSEDSMPQYWFRVRGNNASILHGSPALGTLMFEFELGLDISSIELPQDDDVAVEFPLIVLTLCETDRTKLFIKKNSTFDRIRPMVAIKLSPSHSEWSLAWYKDMESLIKASKAHVRSLNAPAVRIRWQTFQGLHGNQVMEGASTLSPQAHSGRPRPRPTFVGARDCSNSKLKLSKQPTLAVGSSKNTSSERNDHTSSVPLLTASTKQPQLLPAVIHEPLADIAKRFSPQGSVGKMKQSGDVWAETEQNAGAERSPTKLMINAASESHLETTSDLSQNHKEVKEILKQALDLLGSGSCQ